METITWRLGTDAALGLVNSAHGPGSHYRRRARAGDPPHDHLTTPEAALEFLSTHAIPVPDAPPSVAHLERLRGLRAAILALADDPSVDVEAWRADRAAALSDVTFRLRPDGAMRSAADGWDGIADDLVPAALALSAERERFRRCGNPLCGWLFVDRSRGGRRLWCEAAVCGNRVKVGRHRKRRAAEVRAADQPPR